MGVGCARAEPDCVRGKPDDVVVPGRNHCSRGAPEATVGVYSCADALYSVRLKALRETVPDSGRRTRQVGGTRRETVADMAVETATKHIATMSSTPILAPLKSASGASVVEAESTEYQPTPLWSGLFAMSMSMYDACREEGKK